MHVMSMFLYMFTIQFSTLFKIEVNSFLYLDSLKSDLLFKNTIYKLFLSCMQFFSYPLFINMFA